MSTDQIQRLHNKLEEIYKAQQSSVSPASSSE
jgi:hypothetical protein